MILMGENAMRDSTQESARTAVLEQVLHHHFIHAQRGLLPAIVSPYKLKQVLDIHCRIGAWAVDMVQSYPNIRVIGLDSDPIAIDIARRNAEIGQLSRVRFYESQPLKRLPLADASFDFVHSLQLVPMLRPDEWPDFLRECRRVMKSGAAITVTSLSIGPTSSEAYQRILLLFDMLLRQLGYGFTERAGTTPQGVHLFELLKAAGFLDASYAIHPVNFGGPNNAGGRACCHLLADIARKNKAVFLEHNMIGSREFDALFLQKQRDVDSAAYCSAGALISVTAYAP